MLMGEGIPFVGNEKVSEFLGLLVSWFLDFLVSKFLSFKNQSFKIRKPFNDLRKILIPYDQVSISCFLEDSNRIFKSFTHFKTDLHDLPRPSFPIVAKHVYFLKFEMSQNNNFRK